MTVLDAPATSTGPGTEQVWRRARGPLAVLAALLVAALVLGALSSGGSGRALDPGSYSPDGSRAVAALLEDGGVAVRVVGDLPELRAALRPGTTVLVPEPQALTDDELGALAGLDADLVVTGAQDRAVDALGLPVAAAPADVAVHRPACDLPAAVSAGTALVGGVAYAARPGTPAIGCYATGGRPTLLALPAERTVLVGAADLLTNDELDREGDAALAVGLLGGGEQVLWLLPRAGRPLTGERPSLTDLVPDAVPWGALQLALAVGVLALWRARRLGRVVEEPLPAVVRAAETVEARSRLYRLAGARDRAAQSLRDGARDRLVAQLGLPAGTDRPGVVAGVAARSGRAPAEVDALLYGPPPGDDATLVRLADDLDRLVPTGP